MHIDELERYWLIAVSVALGAFGAALLASVFIFRVQLPSPVARIDPAEINESAFADPGLKDMGDNTYAALFVAQMWAFTPGEIRLPKGADVTFFVVSRDISHGFFVEQHNINLMLLPGQIASATTRFDRPGTYRIICHEFCGPGHQNMVATIIVEDTEENIAEEAAAE